MCSNYINFSRVTIGRASDGEVSRGALHSLWQRGLGAPLSTLARDSTLHPHLLLTSYIIPALTVLVLEEELRVA